jgi:hypothetical protein
VVGLPHGAHEWHVHLAVAGGFVHRSFIVRVFRTYSGSKFVSTFTHYLKDLDSLSFPPDNVNDSAVPILAKYRPNLAEELAGTIIDPAVNGFRVMRVFLNMVNDCWDDFDLPNSVSV